MVARSVIETRVREAEAGVPVGAFVRPVTARLAFLVRVMDTERWRRCLQRAELVVHVQRVAAPPTERFHLLFAAYPEEPGEPGAPLAQSAPIAGALRRVLECATVQSVADVFVVDTRQSSAHHFLGDFEYVPGAGGRALERRVLALAARHLDAGAHA